MKKQLLYLIIGLFFNLNASAIYRSEISDNNLINDGPYIFIMNNELKVKWIENNVLREDFIMPDNFTGIKKKFKLLFNYDDLKRTYLEKPEYGQIYNMADSIGIITDIHGEYHTYIDLLKAMGIIDKNLNWKFGKGHLVVLGDTFDRGDMVTEVLWHLFGLEKQAAKAGGMVHVLLGNHEFMVLSKDLSFINEKYEKVETISNTKYYDLYSDSSVLGKWLRSKPVVITINNIIFVHAGLSIEIVQRNLTIDQINRKFSNKIVGKDPEFVSNNEELTFLNKDKGPIWYRGYFRDTSFCESRIDSILDFYDKDHIVIGHTPNEGIKSLFNNKIFGTDAGIMYKEPEEMLMYKNGSFYKVFITGKRIKL
ncbi:MAG: metallophosphoesterase [Bacteroidales bacterium]|nr:metallophosphoesterase [Bacteroidales bacterium]